MRTRSSSGICRFSSTFLLLTTLPHLLIGAGIAAAQAGRRVRYVTCAKSVDELAEAADDLAAGC